MPLSLVCGAECQIHSGGSGAVADRHWSLVFLAGSGSAVTIDSSVQRSGSNSFRFVTGAAGTTAQIYHQQADVATTSYFRGYFRLPSVSPSSETTILDMSDDGPTTAHLVVTTISTLRLLSNMTYSSTNNLSLSADTWYGVEIETVAGTGSKWRVWTESGGWTTSETVSDTGTTLDEKMALGLKNASGSFTMFWDDIAIGFTSGLYDDTGTNGVDGYVLRYSPESDGTHTHALGDFEYDGPGGTDIAVSATDVYSHLDAADMEQTAESIYHTDTGTSEYVAVNFADEATYYDPRGVSVVRHIGTGVAAGAGDRVSDNGTDWTTLAGGSASTSGQLLQEVLALAPSGAGWTRTLVNTMRARCSHDTWGPVELFGIALEVEWTSSEPPIPMYYTAPTDDVTTTGWSSTPLWSKIDDDPDSPDATVITGAAS